LEALLLRNPPPNAPTSPLFHRRFVVFVVGCLCLFSTVSVVVAFILPVVTYSFSINTRSAKLLVLAFQKKRGHQQTFLACASDKSHNCGDSNKLSTSNYFFFERTAKALPRFILDEERKKASARPVFLMENWTKKPYNWGECSTSPIQLWYNQTTNKTHATTCFNLVESTQTNNSTNN
jgi:hypothetical protein